MPRLDLMATGCLLLALAATGHAEPAVPGKVADLAWMTGSWSGPMGEQTLEENWIRPTDGSIASLVRATGNGVTSMVELIVIEEENDTLVLRIQQFNPGFQPRTPAPQTMLLSNLGEQQVTFTAAGEGGMKSLTYSRPAPDDFVVGVETGDGAKFDIKLQAR